MKKSFYFKNIHIGKVFIMINQEYNGLITIRELEKFMHNANIIEKEGDGKLLF